MGGEARRGDDPAPPGAGKSTLSIEQAVAVATGREITGQTVHETAKTWVWNNEDDSDELRRRLAAVLQHWSIPIEEIRGRIALNSGADRALMVARAAKDGSAVRTPDVDALVERIRAAAVGLLVVDPFAEVHAVEENDNARVREVAALFREVARRGDCAVLLIHHTSKPAAASSDAYAGNQNAARGASSLTGVARVVQTLFAMSERDADR
ncbi:MAG: AAA family ATPase [Rhizobiales bacterium]|nr:AAA family ATPase [Hyphomicrobiales bacterium]